MIGQSNIREILSNTDNERMANFHILVGGRGSGRSTLAKEIAKKLNANFIVSGIKVDEIREMIDNGYKIKDKSLYCIKDADTMRPEAKNAMLKITEEPPKNAFFVLTIQDESTLLDTLRSRGRVFNLEPYSRQELKEYYTQKYNLDCTKIDTIFDIATTPYEVDMLVNYGQEFIDYVELVVDNIAEVQPANAFKSANKLSFKEDEEKYDLKIFFNTFIYFCFKRLADEPSKYSKGICVTDPYLQRVSKLGANKSQIYDDWVFSIREAWYDYT